VLSLLELERAARILERDWTGARVEKLVQPDVWRLAIVLYAGGGQKGCLLLCCRPGFARAALCERAPRAPATPPPFAAFLRRRLVGGRLVGARARGGDRQLELAFEGPEGRVALLLSLLGRRSNLYALDADDRLLRALRPLEQTRAELAPGEPWSDPASGPPRAGEDRLAEVGDDTFLLRVEELYREAEEERGESDLARRLETALRKEARTAERRLERLEQDLAEAEEAGRLQRRGELLKLALHRVSPRAESVRVEDPESGEEVEIPLDPSLSPQRNLEALFKRYQKMIRRLTKAGGQVDEARERLEAVRAWQRELEQLRGGEGQGGGEALEELASREPLARILGRHAPAERPAAPPRRDDKATRGPFKGLARRLQPRRYRSRDGLEIWVGRSDEGNDHLSTRLARGNDLFFHLDGAPGSHVVLRAEGRTDPPQESLLDAAELAVHFSKAKRAGRADVHVSPIKRVKKPKGSKPGLVMVTGGRTLHLRREPARLERLLASVIDEA